MLTTLTVTCCWQAESTRVTTAVGAFTCATVCACSVLCCVSNQQHCTLVQLKHLLQPSVYFLTFYSVIYLSPWQHCSFLRAEPLPSCMSSQVDPFKVRLCCVPPSSQVVLCRWSGERWRLISPDVTSAGSVPKAADTCCRRSTDRSTTAWQSCASKWRC